MTRPATRGAPRSAPRTVQSEQSSELGVEALGGKGLALAQLIQARLPVPRWLCVTTAVCSEMLARVSRPLVERLSELRPRDREGLRRLSESLRQEVVAMGLDAADQAAIHEWAEDGFASATRFAVRSSAVAEDSTTRSYAGQFETYLHVPREQLAARVLECIASLFSERALLYRHLHHAQQDGAAAAPIAMAVVIQQMVESRSSGVLFTANPSTGDREEMVISSSWGLGEGVVNGTVECDTFFIDARSGQVRGRSVAPKTSRVVFNRHAGFGTAVESVEPQRVQAPSLDDREIAGLVDLARTAQALHAGSPQDVEWAVDADGAVFLLQSRPITTLDAGRETIFDNANVVESFPGVSSPLTYSFVRAAYEKTFRAGARAFGIPAQLLFENQALFENLVSYVEGRIYYNILNWYGLYQLVPGFEGALPAWEHALGLTPRTVRAAPARRGQLRVKLRVTWRILSQLLHLPRRVDAFLRELAAVRRRFGEIDLRAQEPHVLLELHESIGRSFYEPYAISLVNDFFAQQLHEQVGRWIHRWELGDRQSLRNDLFCGERGMDSVAPLRSVLGLVRRIREDAALRAIFEGGAEPRAVWARLQQPDCAVFLSAVSDHLRQFGDRTLHELKLESPLLDEDPTLLVASIRNLLRADADLERMEEHERAARTRAEEGVYQKLRRHPIRSAVFRAVLSLARRSVKYRENLRLGRTQACGMVKRIFRVLGEKLAERRVLDAPDDIFFLTTEEVAGALRGHGVTSDLRALTDLRRAESRQFEQANPEPRVVIRGIAAAPGWRSAARRRHLPAFASSNSAVLHGVGCSHGRVRAGAKIVSDPSADLDVRGEILVAPMTDPGWVFLMVASSGIISERGSLLSHTAIIGRELGIPTVVGVKDATRILREGEPLELDAAAGIVRRLEATSVEP